ncbi:MAG: pilus assembly protein HicB [Verrucomicrobiota bacterium]
MKTQDQYLKFVRWSDEDQLYVGFCPDLFPWGGVCHGETEEQAYGRLCALVREEVQQLGSSGRGLPLPGTRPMRDAVPG